VKRGVRLYPISGLFAPVSRISLTSIARTSASVAVSDSQRISLRTVRSRRCSARSAAIRAFALGLPKYEIAPGAIVNTCG